VFGTPRPNEYYPTARQEQLPIISNRSAAKNQVDNFASQVRK
jgi:photosystem II cytochrome b559 subunit alpha